jgi:hypothetical protein
MLDDRHPRRHRNFVFKPSPAGDRRGDHGECLRASGWPGSAESTIARCLAAEHGLSVYATDDVMLDHARPSTPEEAPQLSRFMDMDTTSGG